MADAALCSGTVAIRANSSKHLGAVDRISVRSCWRSQTGEIVCVRRLHLPPAVSNGRQSSCLCRLLICNLQAFMHSFTITT